MTANTAQQMIEGADTRLLIDESPYQFLPGLAQMFGDTGALILQQLHYVSRAPYFEGERLKTRWFEGFFWVRIEGFMWWDELEGFCRHLERRTFERHKTKLENEGVLLVRDRLGRDRADNSKWFAINYAALKQREASYREEYEAKKLAREAERNTVRTESGGTEHWRPGIITPEEQSERQNVAPFATVKKDADTVRQNDASLPTKRRNGTRQSDAMDPANVSQSTINTEISLDISKTTTEAASPPDAVAEKSFDFLPEEEFQLPHKSLSTQKLEEGEVALPGMAVLPVADTIPHSLQEIAQRLLELSEAHARSLDADTALRLARSSEISLAGKARLRALITADWKSAGLSGVVGGQALKDLLANEDDLRWHLFAWPAHRQAVVDYYTKKGKNPDLTGAFIRKYRENEEPPIAWLDALMQADAAKLRAAAAQEARREAEAFWTSLTDAQKRAFENELRRHPPQLHGQWIPAGTPEYNAQRFQRLNDPEIRARVLAAQSGASAPESGSNGQPRPFEAPEKDVNYTPHPRVIERCQSVHIPKLVRALRAGDLAEADLEAECKKTLLGPRDEAWLAEQVRAALDEKQVAKAA